MITFFLWSLIVFICICIYVVLCSIPKYQQMKLHMSIEFLHTKWNIQLNKQPTQWEKFFTSSTLNKGLIYRIYKEHKRLNTNTKEIKLLVNKWANERNWQFQRKEEKTDRQMANNYFWKCSIFWAIREMQIKTTMRYCLTPDSWLSSRNLTTNAGEDVERKEPLFTGGGVNQFGDFPQN